MTTHWWPSHLLLFSLLLQVVAFVPSRGDGQNSIGIHDEWARLVGTPSKLSGDTEKAGELEPWKYNMARFSSKPFQVGS